ncbi:MAG: cation transporter [Spirochaetes bacterium GWB1_36_13]|nr:MAG: cation transporter [Spirochaetes bacterium GWB1_36_13]
MLLCNDIRAQKANKATWVGFIYNLILTALKLLAGILGRSGAMIADAIHSLSDFITDIVVLVSFSITRKPIDKNHDYGHGKFETLATALIGTSLLAVGVGILWSGGKNIYLSLSGQIIGEPGWVALGAAILSIVVKEGLYRYTAKIGKEINSQAVVANAWHHRSDAFSSIGAMAGIGGAIFLGEKWRILDPIASVIVSIFILKTAFQIALGSFKELLEESLDEETESKIIELIQSTDGVFEPHNLRTRKIGNQIAVNVHIRVEETLNVAQAHDISTVIEKKIRAQYGEDSFIDVHIEPFFQNR